MGRGLLGRRSTHGRGRSPLRSATARLRLWVLAVHVACVLGTSPEQFNSGGAGDDRFVRMASEPDGSAHYVAFVTTGATIQLTRRDSSLQSALWTWSAAVPASHANTPNKGMDFVMGVFLYKDEVILLSQPSMVDFEDGVTTVTLFNEANFTVRRFSKSTGSLLLSKTITVVYAHGPWTVRGAVLCNDKLYLAIHGAGSAASYAGSMVYYYGLTSNNYALMQIGESWSDAMPCGGNRGSNYPTPFYTAEEWDHFYACNIQWHKLTCGEAVGNGFHYVYMAHTPSNITKIDPLTNLAVSTATVPVPTTPFTGWNNDVNQQYPGKVGLTTIRYDDAFVSSTGAKMLAGVYWPTERYYTAVRTTPDIAICSNCMVMWGAPHLVAVSTVDMSIVWDVALPVDGGTTSFHSLQCPGSTARNVWNTQNGGSTGSFRLSTNNYLFNYIWEITNEAQHIAFTNTGDIVIAYPSSVSTGGQPHQGGFDTVVAMHSRTDGSQIAITQIGSSGDDYAMELHVVGSVAYVTAMVTGAFETLAFQGGALDVVVTQVQLGTCPPGQYVTSPACGPCAAGTISNSTGAVACTNCPAGSSSASGTSVCFLCPAGTYSSAGEPCTSCPAGSFSSADGSTLCTPCPSGRYSTTTGATECDPCPVGKYQDAVGQTSCKSCGANGETDGEGSNSAQFCACKVNTYGDSTLGEDCMPCPDLAECPRGSLLPMPDEGHFILSSEPNKVLNCWPTAACPGETTDNCDEGYEGSACSQCSDGYWREDATGSCLPCAPDQSRVWLGVVLILPIVAVGTCISVTWVCIVAILAMTVSAADISHKNYYTFKYIISMQKEVCGTVTKALYQVIGTKMIRLFQLSSITMAIPIEWPVSYRIFVQPMSVFAFSTGDITRVDCWGGSDAIPVKISLKTLKFLALSSTPLVFALGYLLIASLCRCLCRSDTTKRTSRLSTLLSVFWKFWDLVYLPVHTGIVATLSCYDSGDGLAMRIEPSVKCYSSDPQWMVPWMCALVAFGFVSLGVPWAQAASIWFCVSPRHAERGKMLYAKRIVRVSLDSFTSSYEERYFFWPCVDMLGKFLLPLGYLLAGTGSNESDSLVYMTFVSFFFICAQLMAWPYAHTYEDTIDAAVKLFFFMLSFSGYVFLSTNVSEILKRTLETAVILSLICLMIVTLVFAILLMYDEGRPALAQLCPCVKLLQPKGSNEADVTSSSNGLGDDHDSNNSDHTSENIVLPVVESKAMMARRESNPFLKGVKSSSKGSADESRPAKAKKAPQVNPPATNDSVDASTDQLDDKQAVGTSPKPSLASATAKRAPPPTLHRTGSNASMMSRSSSRHVEGVSGNMNQSALPPKASRKVGPVPPRQPVDPGVVAKQAPQAHATKPAAAVAKPSPPSASNQTNLNKPSPVSTPGVKTMAPPPRPVSSFAAPARPAVAPPPPLLRQQSRAPSSTHK